MRVWFMYDNHTFGRVGDGSTSRAEMEAKAREFFAQDGCGSLFASDPLSGWVANVVSKLQPNGKYGVSDADLATFFDSVDEHVNWLARG